MILRNLRGAVFGRALTFALLVAFASACATVPLISDYDEPTDKALTAIQQASDDFIAKLIADAPSEKNAFDKHEQFYKDTDQQLRRLEFRVASIPKNSQTIKLVGDIRASLLGDGQCSAAGTSLKDLHCNPDGLARGPSITSLKIAHRNVNQTIGAALALELAKRQGLEPNKSSSARSSMTTGTVTMANLGENIFAAAKASFGSNFALIKPFLKSESEKLAVTLRMIVQASVSGQITKTEAKILLNQQKVAMSAVLTSAEGMTAVAVQSGINDALKVVKDFVNTKIGFPLL